MWKFRSNLSTSVFSLVFLACIFCSNASLEPEDVIDMDFIGLESFKNDIFSPEIIEAYGSKFNAPNNMKCLKELGEIGFGLYNNTQEWALRIVDAWGKLPSAFLDGNLNELGGFTECISIKRNNKFYESKYCLGEISLKPEENQMKMSHRSVHLDNGIFPNIWKSHDDDGGQLIEPRAMTPPTDGIPPFKFALCVPAVCSMEFLQTFTNFSTRIKLSESTCQVRDTGSELRTLDFVSIELLVIIAILVLISTGYDIYYTLYNYDKTPAFLAFSIYTNGKKVLSYKKSKSTDTMQCLNGIRVISTAWVVMGHSFVMFVMVPMRNMSAVALFFTKYQNMVLMSAPISVDTFFVLSGLLVSMNMLKHLKQSNGWMRNLSQIPLIYFHRYLRLTPLLFAVVLFSITMLRFLGSGPLWPMFTNTITDQCERYWWSTLLYVQNYVNPAEICLPHTWYLSVDMQLFLVAPFIVLLINWFGLFAIFALVLMICGCCAWTVIVHVDNGFKSILAPNKFQVAYVPTHLRFSSWLVGFIAGYIFLKFQKRSIRIPRLFNLFAWAVSLLVMVTVIFINYPLVQMDSKIDPIIYGFYDGLSRILWSIALCYIIFACVHNSGGPVNWFLSHPLWQPIQRLSYAMYLVHFPVIVVMMVTTKASLYFSELIAFHGFIGNYVLSFGVALIATFAFESPIVILEKLLFKSKKKQSNSADEAVTIQRYNQMDHEQPQSNHAYRF